MLGLISGKWKTIHSVYQIRMDPTPLGLWLTFFLRNCHLASKHGPSLTNQRARPDAKVIFCDWFYVQWTRSILQSRIANGYFKSWIYRLPPNVYGNSDAFLNYYGLMFTSDRSSPKAQLYGFFARTTGECPWCIRFGHNNVRNGNDCCSLEGCWHCGNWNKTQSWGSALL